jgi:4-hydroxy-2-oxoglutarate aldolase
MWCLKPANSKVQNGSTATLSAADLRGVLLPVPTPFDSNEKLDLPALAANIGKWNSTGIVGYVVLGSTGERVHLDEREYLAVIEAARHDVPEDFVFIAGAGQQSTLGTISEIKRAAGAGVDAVLVITPSFYRSAITPAALVKHYRAVADAAPVPLILYSMPDLTGIKIDPETVAALCGHANIIGIKDSSADMDGLKETIKRLRNSAGIAWEDFAVLTGNGTVLFEALAAGAQGAILAVGCVAPALCIQIFGAMQKGNEAHAQELQQYLSPLAKAVTKTYGIGGLKAALELIGYMGGTVRAPLQSPGREAIAEIASLLENASAIPSASKLVSGNAT